MNFRTYIETEIVPYLSKNNDGEYIMPDIEADIVYFSNLHSWYKHFRKIAVKVYPILKLNREPRNSFYNDKTEKNNLHWWFIIDQQVDAIEDDGTSWWLEMEKVFPLDQMRKHHVHLSSSFSGPTTSDLYKFHNLALTTECLQLWDEIMNEINSK